MFIGPFNIKLSEIQTHKTLLLSFPQERANVGVATFASKKIHDLQIGGATPNLSVDVACTKGSGALAPIGASIYQPFFSL